MAALTSEFGTTFKQALSNVDFEQIRLSLDGKIVVGVFLIPFISTGRVKCPCFRSLESNWLQLLLLVQGLAHQNE